MSNAATQKSWLPEPARCRESWMFIFAEESVSVSIVALDKKNVEKFRQNRINWRAGQMAFLCFFLPGISQMTAELFPHVPPTYRAFFVSYKNPSEEKVSRCVWNNKNTEGGEKERGLLNGEGIEIACKCKQQPRGPPSSTVAGCPYHRRPRPDL